MRQITDHMNPGPYDRNNRLHVTAGSPGSGGAATEYYIAVEPCTVGKIDMHLGFASEDTSGLTDDVLLAIVYDRLQGFQSGSGKCVENDRALGHLASAMHHLKSRAARIASENPEVAGPLVKESTVSQNPQLDAPAAQKCRLEIVAGQLKVYDATGFTVTGCTVFSLDELRYMWRAWSPVESAVKKLDPHLTAAEVAVLDSIATTDAARNGLAELKSALRGAGKL